MRKNLENFDKIRTYHEKDENDNRTGRSITVLWEGLKRYVGISRCSSKDNFSKKVGRSISLERAVSARNILTNGGKRSLNAKCQFAFTVTSNTATDSDCRIPDIPEFTYLEKTEASNG